MAILAPAIDFISSKPSAEAPTSCRVSAATLYAKRKSRSSTDLGHIPDTRGELGELRAPLSAGKAPVKRCSLARLNMGFLPLPPIIASPVCSPTSSVSSEDNNEDPRPRFELNNRVSLRVLVSTPTPTWISTPPTPPTKATRHSSAIPDNARAPASVFTPSASFPASMHPHAGTLQGVLTLRKCISTPNLVVHQRDVPEPPQLEAFPSPRPASSRRRSLSQSMVHEVGGMQEAFHPYPKAIFHLAHPGTDNEDEGESSPESRPRSINDDSSPEGSWSDYDVWESERNKEAARRYHALKELLSTELGYLMDLKAFVTIYLRNLPTLHRTPVFNSTFGRASASFSSGQWNNSYTQLHTLTNPPASAPVESQVVQSSVSFVKDVPKFNTRYLFTDNELDSVLRNAEELLRLHEHFVKELTAIVEGMGISMEHSETPLTPRTLDNLDVAIRTVSAKFATEASRFNAYQSFCAGHLEALDLVRKVSQQHPSEWEAFEQRCSVMVSDLETGKAAESEPKSTPTHHSSQVTEDRTRALSLTSLDGAVRSLRLICPAAKDGTTAPEPKREPTPTRRIALIDYMIKPIQRICKYPLLFDQLLANKGSTFRSSLSDVDVVVKSASQAMRHVASSVDEARHRQDAAMQSSLIASRMFLGGQMLLTAAEPSIQILTSEFLSSLGSCLLAGALDVMHHHPLRPLGSISSFKAKYLGAFLYPGGYLILVKVFKGRKYEPKHWFSLTEFSTSDVEEGEAMLPHSIRISCGEQHFELAASCQREKDIWLSSMRDSVKKTAQWVNEPTPSFKFDEKGGLISSLSSEPEVSIGLTTIQSIPELSKNTSNTELSEPFFASLRGPPSSKSKMKLRLYEPPTRPETSLSTSRRSSTTSVKSMFGPIASDPETIVIRRSSPVARLHVDQALRDVTSPACLNARMYAYSHDEELFRSGSNSGVTRTKSRLSKHESIRVRRSKTIEGLDSLISKSPSRRGTIASRRNTRKLSITPMPRGVEVDDEKPIVSEVQSSEASTPPSSSQSIAFPPPLVHTDTASSSTSGLLTPPVTSNEMNYTRVPKSLARGVRDLFHFRTSFSSTSDFHSSSYIRSQEPASSHGSSVLHRWTIDSIRRRPRSVPELHPEHRFDYLKSLVPNPPIEPSVAAA